MDLKSGTRYIIAAITLLLVGSVLYYFRDIVSYIIIAWVVSMIGNPLVIFLRKYMGKNAAAGLTLTSFILLFCFMLYMFIPPLVNQAKYLSDINYQEVINSLEEPIEDWENWLIHKKLLPPRDTTNSENLLAVNEKEKHIFEQKIMVDSLLNPQDSAYHPSVSLLIKIDASELIATQKQDVEKSKINDQDFFGKLRTSLSYYMNPARIQSFFSSTVSAFGNLIVGIGSVIFISFFFLREQGLFYHIIKSAVPTKHESSTEHAINKSSQLLIRYFIGIMIQMSIITIFVSTLLLLLGIDNALLIGFFAAITNVIPYIGPIIGASFAVMITISSNLDVPFYEVLMPQLTRVMAVFIAMQLMDNFVLQPNIFSKSVKAHPLEIFLIVLIGAKIGGVLGMILAIPFYTVFRVIAKVFLSEFKVIQSITKNI